MDVIHAIETRRSIGRVKQDPVPRDLIERILESAVHAPNHRITEPWRFHVFTSKGRGELARRSEEHTSELQSRQYLVCRLLLEKKKNNKDILTTNTTISYHFLMYLLLPFFFTDINP